METEKSNGNGSHVTPPTALALRDASALSAYEPRSYTEAIAMATTFAKTSSGDLRITPEMAYLKMATGAELGIPATTAMRMIDVADFGRGNQVSLRAQLMVGLCLRAKGICDYFEFVSGDDKSATYRTRRHGREEQTETYTIEQARRAGLVKEKSAWEKDPASQLIARASSRLARRVYPDVCGGLYTFDELREAAQNDRELRVIEPAPILGGDERVVSQSEPPKPIVNIAAELERKLLAARSKAEGDAITPEIVKAFPDKNSPERSRFRDLIKAREAAKWVLVEDPPHDPKTGEVEERQPGEEG